MSDSRNLQDALERAKSLRDFKAASSERFEKCPDFEDIVNLADEVERLTARQLKNSLPDRNPSIAFPDEEDHTESW